VEVNCWQALHAHLEHSREALKNGDTATALAEVDSALAIDPEFTGARVLCDRITSLSSSPETVDRPIVSAEGYARFEQRARQRRIDRRMEAARAAIAAGRLCEAEAAIDEVRELDPESPDLVPVLVALDDARQAPVENERRRAPASRGPQLAAAAVFAGVMLAAPWTNQSHRLLSRPLSMLSTLVTDAQPLAPLPATSPSDPPSLQNEPEASSDAPSDVPVRAIDAPAVGAGIVPVPRVEVAAPPSAPTETSPDLLPRAVPIPPPPEIEPSPVPPIARETTLPATAAAPREVATTGTIADDALIRQALQRYRVAYERLDAASAQAVYPAVNERALARAFDDLESQRLTFDSCDVQVKGESAIATCRGTARYVAKVGSRDPRIEARVWNFALRRTGGDWKIDNARAER
jgi:hypothetical protein